MFGTYENETVNLDTVFDGDDSVWDAAPQVSVIPPGKYQLRIVKFEEKANESTGSFGFQFYFVPVNAEDGTSVPDSAVAMFNKNPLRKYFYIGNRSSGKMVTNSFANQFTEFLISIGVTRENNKQKFNNNNLAGILVNATLELGEKKLSTKENPETGKVPTEIDESDPRTYVQFLQIADLPVRGVRDGKGNVKKVMV